MESEVGSIELGLVTTYAMRVQYGADMGRFKPATNVDTTDEPHNCLIRYLYVEDFVRYGLVSL